MAPGRQPRRTLHRLAPSIWENASYCSLSGSSSREQSSTRPPRRHPHPGSAAFSASQLIENFAAAPARQPGISRPHDHDHASGRCRDHRTADHLRAPAGRPPELTITGEDRPDISAEFHVHSNGYDDAEAQRLAKATVLTIERDGVRMLASLAYPREGRQSATLVMRVPSRLQIKLDPTRSPTRISGVAEIDLTNSGGESEFKRDCRTRVRDRIAVANSRCLIPAASSSPPTARTCAWSAFAAKYR